jgi:hypothetical protein
VTKIADRKTKMRGETSARYRGAALMVSVESHDCIIRAKGRRTAYAVPWPVVYETGMKLAALETRRLKSEAKQNRRKK